MKKNWITFLILISTAISIANLVGEGWLFSKERVDLPRETKELVVDTIKQELLLNTKCVKESCRKEVKNLENVLEEVSYANQLGRLDTISLILALFGLVLGFGAVAGFLHIKENAERIAQIETKKWMDNNGKEVATILRGWIEDNRKDVENIIKSVAAEKMEGIMPKKKNSKNDQDNDKKLAKAFEKLTKKEEAE